MSQHGDTVDSDELTAEEIAALTAAGASPQLITVVTADTGNMENSARRETMKYLRGEYGPDLTEETAEEFSHQAGDYYGNLWDGDLYGAMRHSDGTNSHILSDVFGLARINASAPEKTPYVWEEGRVVWDS